MLIMSLSQVGCGSLITAGKNFVNAGHGRAGRCVEIHEPWLKYDA